MDCGQVGALIRRLRKEQGLTQLQLAQRLGLSDKTISKWERGFGCPDVSLLREVAAALQVSLEQLLAGQLCSNDTDGGNMKRVKIYVCPACGNILTATGAAALSCCGRTLEPLPIQPVDAAHAIKREEIDGEWYLTFSHPMTKAHYLTFAAYVTCDRLYLHRLYPEQSGELRMPMLRGGGKLYVCCNTHGLFEVK